MRLHFNKIGYSMYGKEQSRRVPSLVSSLIQCVSVLCFVFTLPFRVRPLGTTTDH